MGKQHHLIMKLAPQLFISFLYITQVFISIGANYLFSEVIGLEKPTLCEHQWSMQRQKDAKITFITPSKGRSSLLNTFSNLLNQSNPNWLQVVVFDGLITNSFYMNTTTNLPIFLHDVPRSIIEDGRFCFQYLPAAGRLANCAADIRNYGIKQVVSEWVGFVDDDDTLKPSYVDQLLAHSAEYPIALAVMFRMCQDFWGKPRVIPGLDRESLKLNDVGISFAVKRKVFHELNYSLIPSPAEDFFFMDRLFNDHIPILLSEHVTYKVKDYGHAICNEVGNRTLLHLENELQPECAEFIPCKPLEHANPTFFYTEYQSPFFQHNIKGLNSALQVALQQRCFADNYHYDDGIHVIFNAKEKPSSPHYIQVQLEQRNSFHFTPEYREKLSKALQIWEFGMDASGSGKRRIEGIDTEVYFVPTMLTLRNTSVYGCASPSAEVSVQSFMERRRVGLYPLLPESPFSVYRYGKYYECAWNGKEFFLNKITASECEIRPDRDRGYCWKTSSLHSNSSTQDQTAVDANTICMDVVNRTSPIDVLMFGLITRSYENQREMLCDQLSVLGIHALCVQTVFGRLLTYLVCSSKIIVVNHYFETSELETHRIDPLLLAGKVVIASTSPSILDSYYSSAIPIVPQRKIPAVAKKILKDFDGWLASSHYQSKVARFVHSMTTIIDPLCFALVNLADKLKQRYIVEERIEPNKTPTNKEKKKKKNDKHHSSKTSEKKGGKEEKSKSVVTDIKKALKGKPFRSAPRKSEEQ